jgi:hypothetical protein
MSGTLKMGRGSRRTAVFLCPWPTFIMCSPNIPHPRILNSGTLFKLCLIVLINDILKGQNIIGFIKKQRLNWLGHVECMTEDNVKKIKRWKPMSKRPIGRPKLRWEDDVLEDIKSMNVRNWKNVAQDRERWKKVVVQARTLNRL